MSGDQRRAQLASKAKEVFLEGGYRGTTTKDVAAAAGVSEALIVKHFGSKEELFRHSVIHPLFEMLDRVVRRGPPVVRDIGGQRQSLRDFYYSWAKLVQEEGPLLWVVLREAQDFPDVVTTLAGLFRSHVEEVARRITFSVNRDQFREFDMEVATYVGLAGATIAGVIGGDPDSFVSEVVDLLFVGVMTPAGRHALEKTEARVGRPDAATQVSRHRPTEDPPQRT